MNVCADVYRSDDIDSGYFSIYVSGISFDIGNDGYFVVKSGLG